MRQNRKIAPDFKEIETVKLLEAEKHCLDNNMPVYTINTGTQEVMKIEFLFAAGTYYQSSALVARTVNRMLNEGTSNLSAAEIAEKLDYYGAFLHLYTDKDSASISLFVLNKHLEKTLPILEEIIKSPIFPEKELNTYIQNAKQKFIVNNEKVHFVASNHFNELIFGNHPYGFCLKLTDYDNISREKIISFYQKFYKTVQCRIVVSGKIQPEVLTLLNKYFGQENLDPKGFQKYSGLNTKIASGDEKQLFVKKQDTVQSAIVIGRVLFNKTHPDYMGMQVLNTVLGGYFNSRLNANIREDKGYTYGIGSALVSLQHAGYFFISTEVGTEVCNKTIDEIYLELKKLREEPIPENELKLVKNYLFGTFLRSIDGPFALAEKFKGIFLYKLDYDFYYKFFDTVKHITPIQLNQLANKYLKKEDMYQVVVGKDTLSDN